jgi:hypothetical protein
MQEVDVLPVLLYKESGPSCTSNFLEGCSALQHQANHDTAWGDVAQKACAFRELHASFFLGVESLS